MKRVIYLDVHGVLLDFVQGVADHFRFEPVVELFSPANILTDNEWRTIDVPEFWAGLPRLASGYELLNLLRTLSLDLKCRLVPLTRVMPMGLNGLPGTITALEDIGFDFSDIVIAYRKESCAPGFLIDDEPDNVSRWRMAGGTAFLWPTARNGWSGGTYAPTRQVRVLELLLADVNAAILAWSTSTPITHDPRA